MQASHRNNVLGWVGFAGIAGVLASILMLSGCPGTLDQTLFKTGTGGNSPTGGTSGTGGTASNCTGGNDGASILTISCATGYCHIPGAVNDGTAGGLDLTVDANIGSRLVDVMSAGTADNDSKCGGNPEPYLKGGSTPATGLLIDKVKLTHPPCGDRMPAETVTYLTPAQQDCLVQWATTLTSP